MFMLFAANILVAHWWKGCGQKHDTYHEVSYYLSCCIMLQPIGTKEQKELFCTSNISHYCA